MPSVMPGPAMQGRRREPAAGHWPGPARFIIRVTLWRLPGTGGRSLARARSSWPPGPGRARQSVSDGRVPVAPGPAVGAQCRRPGRVPVPRAARDGYHDPGRSSLSEPGPGRRAAARWWSRSESESAGSRDSARPGPAAEAASSDPGFKFAAGPSPAAATVTVAESGPGRGAPTVTQ